MFRPAHRIGGSDPNDKEELFHVRGNMPDDVLEVNKTAIAESDLRDCDGASACSSMRLQHHCPTAKHPRSCVSRISSRHRQQAPQRSVGGRGSEGASKRLSGSEQARPVQNPPGCPCCKEHDISAR
eukprot:764422-Hanusia_phi.AAC.2